MLTSAAVILWLARRNCPGPLPGALAPIGWVKSSRREILLGALLGVTIAFLYLYVLVPLFPRAANQQVGPLGRLIQAGGWNRHGLVLLALLLAPPIEEFMFRGILFAGFCRSWPVVSSGVLSTMLFLVCHLTDVIYYGPAIFAVSSTGAALWFMRAKTGSLLPPIALHCAYNLGLFVLVYTYTA
jgi:membrane protease YdiL (CAAX protease family)